MRLRCLESFRVRMNILNLRVETIGRLKCRVLDDLDAGAVPQFVVVLCHGYGASGTDLVMLGEELLDRSPELQQGVQFLFPEAPLSLESLGLPGGRAWWHLDMMRLQMASATGQFRDLRAERPEGLEAARERLTETIVAWSEQSGVPLNRFVLGGFSQGAMLSTDVALHLKDNAAALVVMSGTLLNEAEWRELAPQHATLRVLQSHGRNDPLLPFVAAEWLRDLLVSARANVEFVPFPGEHQIPFEVFDKLASMLQGLVRNATRR